MKTIYSIILYILDSVLHCVVVGAQDMNRVWVFVKWVDTTSVHVHNWILFHEVAVEAHELAYPKHLEWLLWGDGVDDEQKLLEIL